MPRPKSPHTPQQLFWIAELHARTEESDYLFRFAVKRYPVVFRRVLRADRTLTLDDLYHLGIIHALRFPPKSKTISFSTWLVRSFCYAAQRVHIEQGRAKRKHDGLRLLPLKESQLPAAPVFADPDLTLEEFLESCHSRERRFWLRYLGLDGGLGATLDEIGQDEGITKERVRQVLQAPVLRWRKKHAA